MIRVLLFAALMWLSGAGPGLAQQLPQFLPLTDWRAQLDTELGKINMSREAHGQVIGVLQAAERQAQAAARSPPASVAPPVGGATDTPPATARPRLPRAPSPPPAEVQP